MARSPASPASPSSRLALGTQWMPLSTSRATFPCAKPRHMKTWYNELDPYAAQWLRNLINAKLITPGDVDDRSILDVRPKDLDGYTRCHFFAGIGGWDLALQVAAFPADRPVWTGSCPCQPFSAAGAQGGFADE